MTKQAQVKKSNLFSVGDIDALRVSIINQSLAGTAGGGASASAVTAEKLLTKKCYDLEAIIEILRTECYLLLKGPKLFQLQTF